MSRFAEVIVLARGSEEVMEHLEQDDDSRRWHQTFIAIDDTKFSGAGFQYRSSECYAWIIQFSRNTWGGLLSYLEALPWPRPDSVQVLVRDEEDDCFGLWMIYDGKLTEVPLPRTERIESPGRSVTGVLIREDRQEPPEPAGNIG
ncbi:hypothetical protein [Nocardia sp. NPDC056100]|uniref:hypothetical protein n=1 Tax=Nocardia sp. NPDC056100 TaxID=3345712 RepID=UPI0035E39AA9